MQQEWATCRVGSVSGIVFAGNQIPDWFTYQCEGPSVHFEVPIVDSILKEFGVCVFTSLHVSVLSSYRISMSFINHTKNTILTILAKASGGPFPLGDHLFLRNIVLTNDFEDGDEAEVVVDWGPEIIVKKISVYLVYEGVVDEEIIHYASTSNEDANNNRHNGHSCMRKARSPNKMKDLQIFLQEKKLKNLTTEKNEYFFLLFYDKISKVSFWIVLRYMQYCLTCIV
jgi:hypothetical protein